MWHEIAIESGKSLWREVGEEVLKKGASTLVTEGTKAFWDIVKRRRIRRDEWEFQQWKKIQEENEADDSDESEADEKNEKSDEAPSDQDSSSDPEEPDDSDEDAGDEEDAADDEEE